MVCDMVRLCASVLACLLLTTEAQAQSLSVVYTYSGAPLATVESWHPVLYVNDTRLEQPAQTCAEVGGQVECRFPLPDVTAYLVSGGDQTFHVALRDDVAGEGGRSVPFVVVRPGAPTVLRIELAP
jgi:hypothetical protein